jgi:hypothetical protein
MAFDRTTASYVDEEKVNESLERYSGTLETSPAPGDD